MKLHYSPGACSLASHIALHESGLPFAIDKFNRDTRTTSTGVDFLKINPKSYVPAIELDDGNILTEGAVILQYIADQSPASNLAPKAGTLERYRLQEWLTFIGTEVHKSYSPLFNPNAAEEVKSYVRNALVPRLAYVEAQLANNDYLMGSGFSVADAYLFVVLNWSKRVGVELGAYPNIQNYMARVAMRPAVQAAMKAEGLLS
jgi:glutathione S-transferase